MEAKDKEIARLNRTLEKYEKEAEYRKEYKKEKKEAKKYLREKFEKRKQEMYNT